MKCAPGSLNVYDNFAKPKVGIWRQIQIRKYKINDNVAKPKVNTVPRKKRPQGLSRVMAVWVSCLQLSTLLLLFFYIRVSCYQLSN